MVSKLKPINRGKGYYSYSDDQKVKLAGNVSQVFDSWELLGDNIALKTVDKSVFVHSTTGIPIGIRDFFEIGSLGKSERKFINLICNNRKYTATIEMDRLEKPRSRMLWKTDFRDLLHEKMSVYRYMFENGSIDRDIKLPKIRFIKVNDTDFEVDFIYTTELEIYVKEEIGEYSIYTTEINKDGKVKYVYSKQYERDIRNRAEAIKYHGTKCIVCGFDFEKVYGLRGLGYIEIHHVNPLSSIGEETDIDPRTDLVPVCANCHRIIHRKRENILNIDEMKDIINTQLKG